MRHLARTGTVSSFLGFPTYCGGPFEHVGLDTTVALLVAFLIVCAAEVVVAILIWGAHPAARSVGYLLLPLELAFWQGV